MGKKISAFSYVRNGFQMEYPFVESIQSVLPIVDEFIVVVGDSTDGTREAVERLSSKIRIIDTVWDMNLRKEGKIFAQQANLGLLAVSGDWNIHIQADEVLHEDDIIRLRNYIDTYDAHSEIDGFLFPFLNFRGDYDHIHTGRMAHRFEIRAFRRNPGIRSYRDSQGFRIFSSASAYEQGEKGEKLRVLKVDVPIYHYSAVRPPKKMQQKARLFSSFYFNDERLNTIYEGIEEFDYNLVDKLDIFEGTHPSVMAACIAKKDWNFEYQPKLSKIPLRLRLLNAFENWTGYRIGEYKNYKLIGKAKDNTFTKT